MARMTNTQMVTSLVPRPSIRISRPRLTEEEPRRDQRSSSWDSGEVARARSRRWSSTRCPPMRPSSWRRPTRSRRTTSPTAPSSSSLFGISLGRWTFGSELTRFTKLRFQVDFFDATFDTDMIFSGCGALIFVIDAQDDYLEALAKLNTTVAKAHHVNPAIRLEVFIHKVDGLSDDTKMDTQRDIHQRATDDLTESGLEQQVHLSFYLTSIYDHSIFEAFSKVVQKLIPQLPTLENLLNVFISNSQIEKAFLFDVISKIYVATDSSPVDMQSYELCCDMIDVVIDVSCIYGLGDQVDTTSFDTQSSSIIRLNNSTILFLKEVNKVLALVCILREENFEHEGLIDFNFACFRRAIEKVFEVRAMKRQPIGVGGKSGGANLVE